ncbi:uncharacterized protein LOC125955606 [Anopheles darlingi]|uniref:uncharacterized protein LOC125955606 n=1 Tax=Anopheles darlingi TaxID=43151 RepID=UPI0021002626|nr:uncharacterized protein LOC125955606 [Anopheles darlingi]
MAVVKNLLFVLALVSVVAAQELVEANTGGVDEGRRRKRFYKFFFKSLGPILSTVATVLLVKAKIVLVALFFAGIYFFGHKIFPGGFFGSTVYSETPPPFIESDSFPGYHTTGYSAGSSYPGYSTISDHPGPEPFATYGPPSSGPQSYSGSHRRRRDTSNQGLNNKDTEDDYMGEDEYASRKMYWTDTLTDMTFRFLGVNQRVCRKRFVCEFDFQAKRNPILLFMTRAIGRDIFHNYRDASDEKANSYKDCGRIYEECKVPKRRKYARRPFPPGRRPVDPSQPISQPPTAETASYDTQENEIDASDATTIPPTISPLRGKLILQPKTVNRFHRN